MRAPLCTCRGRAVGLLHVWLGGYAKTVSGYGKRAQHRQTCSRPRPMRVAAQSARSLLLNRSCRCGLIFSALAWSFRKAINVSPHPSTTDSQRRRRTGPATRLTRGT